jgi:hypothetical protein
MAKDRGFLARSRRSSTRELFGHPILQILSAKVKKHDELVSQQDMLTKSVEANAESEKARSVYFPSHQLGRADDAGPLSERGSLLRRRRKEGNVKLRLSRLFHHLLCKDIM